MENEEVMQPESIEQDVVAEGSAVEPVATEEQAPVVNEAIIAKTVGALTREQYIAKYGNDFGWVPPRQFAEKKKAMEDPQEAKRYMNYLIAENVKLQERLQNVEKNVNKYGATLMQQELQKNMEEQVNAINNGDNAKFQELKKQEYELLQKNNVQQPQPQQQSAQQWTPQAQIEFGNKFWVQENDPMFPLASNLYEQVNQIMPYANDYDKLRETENRLKSMYPERFGVQRVYNNTASNDSVGVRKPAPKKETFENLPKAMQDEYARMQNYGAVGSKESFAAQYYKNFK